jgi:hypothetical protein
MATAHPGGARFLALTGLKAFPASGRQGLARAFVRRCHSGVITPSRLGLIAAVRNRLELPREPKQFLDAFDEIVADARDAAQERIEEIENDLHPAASGPNELMRTMAAADAHVSAFATDELFAPELSLPFPRWLLLALCLKQGVPAETWKQRLRPQVLDELARDAGVAPFLQQINLGVEQLGVDAAEIESARAAFHDALTRERQTLEDLLRDEPAQLSAVDQAQARRKARLEELKNYAKR